MTKLKVCSRLNCTAAEMGIKKSSSGAGTSDRLNMLVHWWCVYWFPNACCLIFSFLFFSFLSVWSMCAEGIYWLLHCARWKVTSIWPKLPGTATHRGPFGKPAKPISSNHSYRAAKNDLIKSIRSNDTIFFYYISKRVTLWFSLLVATSIRSNHS